MEYKEFEGKSTDEAIVAAIKAFRTSYEDLDIKIISEGSKGVFGIGSKLAKIMARPASAQVEELQAVGLIDTNDRIDSIEINEKTYSKEVKSTEIPADILLKAENILKDLLKLMDMNYEAKNGGENLIEIVGDGSGLLIGKHGQTLDSLQFIINRIINKDLDEPVHINLDTEGYKQRHIDTLKSMALKMAQKAKKNRRPVTLDKMNPHDRRIIHLALKEESGVNTKSIGEGLYKKVVIVPRKQSR